MTRESRYVNTLEKIVRVIYGWHTVLSCDGQYQQSNRKQTANNSYYVPSISIRWNIKRIFRCTNIAIIYNSISYRLIKSQELCQYVHFDGSVEFLSTFTSANHDYYVNVKITNCHWIWWYDYVMIHCVRKYIFDCIQNLWVNFVRLEGVSCHTLFRCIQISSDAVGLIAFPMSIFVELN